MRRYWLTKAAALFIRRRMGPVRGPSFFDLQGSHLTKLPHLSRIDVRRCLDDANSNDSVYKEPIPAGPRGFEAILFMTRRMAQANSR